MGYLISIIVFQAVFSLALVMRYRSKSQFDKLLALFLFFIFSHFSTKLFFLVFLEQNPFYYKLPTSFSLFYGPILYLTSKCAVKGITRKELWWHLTPFLIVSVVFLTVIATHGSGPTSDAFGQWYQNLSYGYLIPFIVYPILSLRLLRKNPNSMSKDRNTLLLSLTYVNIAFMGVVLFLVTLHILGYDPINIRLTYVLMLITVVSILLYKINASEEPIVANVLAVAPAGLGNPEKKSQKYESSNLETEDLKAYYKTLQLFLEKEKIYLDPELTLQKLSEKVHIPKHHITQVLNAYVQKNFYQFINDYRIEEAKSLLTSNHKESITDIAYSAGFNSKSTFNTHFKKLTQKTPLEYKKEALGLS
ncbi:AraC family transcriptional regulator [Mangrovimonas sp. TPBH4]|uniref:helix-turn-helix domain-containing protein n=1 Tax=Mangrovimonas sp. TPBH4 TaxID=1645914 RepID=UPI0006B695E2|nr:helix-turn-helix domain-containing protein [Mangrovimonas sp. TPBH4]